jgi:methionine synthase II (cobalamin-independent)
VAVILVFSSQTEVLNAEDVLEAAGLDFSLIPVPKAINPNCGLALRLQDEAEEAARLALRRAGLAIAASYKWVGASPGSGQPTGV